MRIRANHREAASIRWLFEHAQVDLTRRRSHAFTGFNGTGPTFAVKYTVRPAGGTKGLGVFAAEPIAKGRRVYGGWEKPDVQSFLKVIPFSMLKVAKSVASKFPKDVVSQLLQWCELNWLSPEDEVNPSLLRSGLLCEMDDEHFVNNDENPNIDNCGPVEGSVCALRDIAIGEELLENYNDSQLDSIKSESVCKEIELAALPR